MSKYAPFGEYLARQKSDTISLSFGEVEEILGFKLPHSAYHQRAWWSNNPHNNVMTKVWRRAAFRSRDVDMEHESVVFQRKKPPPPAPTNAIRHQEMMQLQARVAANKRGQQRVHHPLRGALKGVLRLVGRTDLTKPAGKWDE